MSLVFARTHEFTRRLLLAITLSILLPHVSADVERVEITSRQSINAGAPFGDAGAYEQIDGTVHFRFDPDHPANSRIVDLDLAPRDEAGFVRASANFRVLQAVDRERRADVAFLEVSNRGGMASLRYFNLAGLHGLDSSWGDGLLMRHGLTVVWVGWQPDVPDRGRGQKPFRLEVPTYKTPEPGLVRCDWMIAQETTTVSLGHRNHDPYPVLDVGDPRNVLTVRDGRLAERRVVPRDSWFLTDAQGNKTDSPTHVTRPDGLEPGKIYELVYRCNEARVVGLGPAAVRDMMAYMKHDPQCEFGVSQGIAFGVSQTGRFLRHFLYQGFNTDEERRPVFDGMLIHTAGAGRGSFNHRFAQPSRDAHRYSAFFYPTDIFPFTSRLQRDDVTGVEDGLLTHLFVPSHLPRIFYTNTGYEYWGRAAALIHVSPDGTRDVDPLPVERIYHLASGQHFVSRFPPARADRLMTESLPVIRGNPLDFLFSLRALTISLVEWVRDDTAPPESMYPRLDEETLVPITDVRWPHIGSLETPTVAHEAYRADYGETWTRGVVSQQPPLLGPAFPTFVPQVDAYGNELAGVPHVETRVPLATYLPWNLRTGLPGEQHELTDFYGTYVPFPMTDAVRETWDDSRPSIKSLYESRATYRQKVTRAATQLAHDGFLLPEDLERVSDRAMAHWDLLMKDVP